MSGVEAMHAEMARVLDSWDETPEFRGIRLEARKISALYEKAGQYASLSVPDLPASYFAFASAPNADGPLEVLIRLGSRTAGTLAGLPRGAEVHMTGPFGEDFPLDAHEGRDLVLIAAGSGIAPIRAALQMLITSRQRYGKISVYYGQRGIRDFAYQNEHASWRAAGIRLVPCLSGQDATWVGEIGRVQEVLERNPPPLDGAVAYVCGMDEMVRDVMRSLGSLGLDEESIFVNLS